MHNIDGNRKTHLIGDLKMMLGILVVMAGVLALLNNLGVNPGLDIWDCWSVILIVK